MTSALLRSTLILALLLAATGCSHRLSGPLHTADGPPWVAPQAAERALPAESDLAIDHRIVLIGDAGYFLEDDPTLAAIDTWAMGAPSSTVVFLGDNIYNEGLTDDDRERGEKILAQQLAATQAHKIVIPGNHDWGLIPKNYNAKSIENQQSFVDGWPAGDAEFIPRDGCMGPVARVVSEGSERDVVVIAFDPTPWIHDGVREVCPRELAEGESVRERYLDALDALLTMHADDHVVLISHYPMLTGGPHGGLTYGFLGDMIVTPLGWMMGGLMNTYEPEYADWITRTQAVMRRNPPDIYAAGHDHNLQLLESGDVAGLYIVSGAGARERVSTVTHLDETIFAHAAEGFVVVDFAHRADGTSVTLVHVVEPMISPEEPVYEYVLD